MNTGGSCLGEYQPIRPDKVGLKERKVYYLWQVKRILGIVSKVVSPPTKYRADLYWHRPHKKGRIVLN